MTQPQHCQHECVCVSFIGSKEWTTQIVCCGKRYGDTCKHDTRTHTPAAPAEPVKFPNSTDLLLMAHTDWKNRIERKHTHDEIPWTDGWIHGYLTPKPDWKRKEQHDTAIRNATLDEAINVVNAFERKPKYDYEVTKCLLITQSLEALKKKVETRDLK